MASIGLMFRRNWPADTIGAVASAAESAGLDELWVAEDLGFLGGFAQASVALATTSTITVGLGIIPAPVRNPAFAAMEAATLANAFPGRFHLGIGHGVGSWIRQVGALPASQMACLTDVHAAVRAMLGGAAVTTDTPSVQLHDVRLHAPPPTPPMISLGVQGPRGLALVAADADGVILGEGASPTTVAHVRSAIGATKRLTVFVVAAPCATAATQHMLAEGFVESADAIAATSIVGEPATWVAQAEAWVAAGADAVVCCTTTANPAQYPIGFGR